eukprot:4184259-Pleurochrysis_carterae.AAC.5
MSRPAVRKAPVTRSRHDLAVSPGGIYTWVCRGVLGSLGNKQQCTGDWDGISMRTGIDQHHERQDGHHGHPEGRTHDQSRRDQGEHGEGKGGTPGAARLHHQSMAFVRQYDVGSRKVTLLAAWHNQKVAF